MGVGQREDAALDIVQTREFTAHEKRDLMRLWEKLIWRNGTGTLYNVLVYLWYGFSAFLGISILMAAHKLKATSPDLSTQLALSAVGFVLLFAAAHRHSLQLSRGQFWTERRTGDRYALLAEGLCFNGARGAFSCNWKNIIDIYQDERRLIPLLPGNSGLFIVKAAFDGHAVEDFCEIGRAHV